MSKSSAIADRIRSVLSFGSLKKSAVLPITLGQKFDSRKNALNTLRLIFAFMVIISHSFDIGGFEGKPVLGDLDPGAFAVASFFVASGYLITQSRSKNSLWRYGWARVLRIFPAFWTCLLVTAFGFSALAGSVNGGWSLQSALGYFVNNMTLWMHQWTVGDTLAGSPVTAWNGSLWTLAPEFSCYAIIGLFFLVPFFRRPWCILVFFAFATSLSVLVKIGLLNPHDGLFPLLPFFLAGATLYQFRSRVPMSLPLFAAAVLTVTYSAASNWGMVGAPLPLAYGVMFLATSLPCGIERIGDGSIDISYGVYIYAFPVAQALMVAGIHRLGVGVLMATTALVTVLPATASWFFVEKPVMKFKHASWPQRTGKKNASRHRPSS